MFLPHLPVYSSSPCYLDAPPPPVLLLHPTVSLDITGSVASDDAVSLTNSTWVVPPGASGVILSCGNNQGVWSYQNGSDVPEAGQEAGQTVHQVLTNGSSGVMRRDLVFTVTLSEGLQGFYQCSVVGGESAYVGVFFKSGLGEWGRKGGEGRGGEGRGGWGGGGDCNIRYAHQFLY